MRGKSARVCSIITILEAEKKGVPKLASERPQNIWNILSAVLTPYFSVFRGKTLVF